MYQYSVTSKPKICRPVSAGRSRTDGRTAKARLRGIRRRRLLGRLPVILAAAAVLVIGWRILAGFRFTRPCYGDEDFSIHTYVSPVDANADGIDDQTEILQEAKAYVAKRPHYKSEYYETGYPEGDNGVCTDVVGYAMLHSGYDLMELVRTDVENCPEAYPDAADYRIDFRRVVNLDVWFRRNAAYTLTNNIREIDQWRGGDIVVFPGHIGIVSDRRNARGVPYVIHHGRVGQQEYEEDILESRDDVIGHYRIS